MEFPPPGLGDAVDGLTSEAAAPLKTHEAERGLRHPVETHGKMLYICTAPSGRILMRAARSGVKLDNISSPCM